jgi:8-oxo-dGTP diphosphatase
MKSPNKWEFPGGKLEQGEDLESCIRREIKEELSLDLLTLTKGPCFVSLLPDFNLLRLHVLICTDFRGEPMASEHKALEWRDPNDLGVLDWLDADSPIVTWLTQSRNRK